MGTSVCAVAYHVVMISLRGALGIQNGLAHPAAHLCIEDVEAVGILAARALRPRWAQ